MGQLLGLSLTACAASLENEILDEAEQAELSDASDVSQPNDSDASDGEQPVDACDPRDADSADASDVSDTVEQDDPVTRSRYIEDNQLPSGWRCRPHLGQCDRL